MSIKIINENIKTKSFLPLYYIYGEEEYLKNYYYSAIKDNAVTDMPEFNIIEFDGKNFSFIDFSNCVNSYPVLSERKVVGVVDLDNSVLKKDFLKDFVQFLKSIPDYCTVVFVDTYLKPTPSTNYLLKAVTDADGVVAQAKHPDFNSLSSWAAKHFKSAKKIISSQDIAYLIDITDSDMLSLSNEISKLCNYVDDDTVTRADIDKLVTRSIDANRYEIADAIYASDYDKIFSILDKLYKQCIDDIVIANIFYKTFLDMWKIRIAYEKNIPSAQFSKDFKMNPYVANKIMRNSLAHEKSFIHYALYASLELDRQLKSTPYNKRDLITAYIAKLVNRRQNNG